ncbi:MAG: hypothetical protein KAR54_01455 [Candidatus Pacebacteria bacterium]|nr:hypothetical protein [Candidatus Paceibacterota bacterium]
MVNVNIPNNRFENFCRGEDVVVQINELAASLQAGNSVCWRSGPNDGLAVIRRHEDGKLFSIYKIS